jgi:hypothetical protein
MSSGMINNTANPMATQELDATINRQILIVNPPQPNFGSSRVVHYDRPFNPDFSFAGTTNSHMLSSAYSVINQYEAWHLLANFKGESFMFHAGEKLKILIEEICNAYEGGHSGCSMGCTMRAMEYISIYGFSQFKTKWISQA